MYSKVKPFLLHAITSVHLGSGSEVGLVDLPIQREQHTGFPKIESSSLKGAIRYTVDSILKENEDRHKLELVFGSDLSRGNENGTIASAVAFSDARILLFPVKSMRGIFAWITCPEVLYRFNNDMLLNQTGVEPLPVPEPNTVSSEKVLVSPGKMILEEYTFKVHKEEETEKLAKRFSSFFEGPVTIDIANRLVVLEDDEFKDFVRLSTEVNARIKINTETGTVDKENGALWYEENIPPETIFYSLLYIGKVRSRDNKGFETIEDVEQFMHNSQYFPDVFQLGGNSTIGHGMIRKIWL